MLRGISRLGLAYVRNDNIDEWLAVKKQHPIILKSPSRGGKGFFSTKYPLSNRLLDDGFDFFGRFGGCGGGRSGSESGVMRLYVFRPFDIAVSGVCEVARFENEQDPLPRHYVDYRFDNRDDIPSDPLFAVTKKYEKTVGDTHGACARVEVSGDIFRYNVVGKYTAFNFDKGEKISDSYRPHGYRGYKNKILPPRELADFGEFGLFLVALAVPDDEADNINRDPEE